MWCLIKPESLQETLHIHKENKEQDELYAWEVAAYGCDVKEKLKKFEGKGPNQQQSLLKNWPLMSSIIVYCVFQLHDMAYAEVNFHVYILVCLENGFNIQDNVSSLPRKVFVTCPLCIVRFITAIKLFQFWFVYLFVLLCSDDSGYIRQAMHIRLTLKVSDPFDSYSPLEPSWNISQSNPPPINMPT